MGLLEKITEDIKCSMKSGDKLRTETLRFLLCDIKYKALNTGKETTDESVIEVISSQIKKRKESIAEFDKAQRNGLSEKTQKEISIIECYMPAQLSRDELSAIITEIIKETGALSQKDMGKVMGRLMPAIKGKADTKLASELVKERLK